MELLLFFNFDLLFSIQIAVILIGTACLIYLVYQIWKNK
ncbi:hypothetical protein FLSI110296_14140 [Flavobacterium sinopsychrotolerans]